MFSPSYKLSNSKLNLLKDTVENFLTFMKSSTINNSSPLSLSPGIWFGWNWFYSQLSKATWTWVLILPQNFKWTNTKCIETSHFLPLVRSILVALANRGINRTRTCVVRGGGHQKDRNDQQSSVLGHSCYFWFDDSSQNFLHVFQKGCLAQFALTFRQGFFPSISWTHSECQQKRLHFAFTNGGVIFVTISNRYFWSSVRS